MIEVKNLHKSFEGSKVLKGISTVFEAGKTNLIIGQSGSGKTVLLKCLLGLFDYEEGSIAYDEKIFLSLSDNEKRTLRSQIGMVFQGGALFDSLTIAENVMFPLRMFTKQSRSEMEDRVNSALKRVNLEDAHMTKCLVKPLVECKNELQLQEPMVNNPKYLFCDEPNSGLDPKTAIVIDNLIQEITQENNIVTVINTHDMNSVMEIGQNIVFLKDGHNAWEGSKDTIFKTDNKVVTDFVYSSNLFKKVRKMYLEDH